MITIHQVSQGSDEWQELRKGLYTGSNAYKLLSYGATSYSLTEGSSFGGNFYTQRGHILEEEAIELYEVITGCHVDRPGFVTNSDFPTCGYSPDGLRQSMVIEVKCFNKDKHMKMFNDSIPLKVLAQVHFGMLICGKRLGNLVIYNPDLEAKFAFKIIPIKYNPAIANNFKQILRGATA